MAGAYVFPGGVIETADNNPHWKDFLDSGHNTPNHPPHSIQIQNEQLPEFAFRVGALRELFEVLFYFDFLNILKMLLKMTLKFDL